MKILGLGLFEKTNQPWTTSIGYHNPHSLTWSWSLWLYFGRVPGMEPGFYLYPRSRYRNGKLAGLSWQWGLKVPFLFALRWATQDPMYYRDMWHRDRDEMSRRDYDAWLAQQGIAANVRLSDYPIVKDATRH